MTEGERIIDDCIAGIENFYARGAFPKRAGFIASYGDRISALLSSDPRTRPPMGAWRNFKSDPPPEDGRYVLAWGKYTMDEYDEDRNRIGRGKVSYSPTILYSMPPFEGWAEFGNRYVQNAEYVCWQDITPPADLKTQ